MKDVCKKQNIKAASLKFSNSASVNVKRPWIAHDVEIRPWNNFWNLELFSSGHDRASVIFSWSGPNVEQNFAAGIFWVLFYLETYITDFGG